MSPTHIPDPAAAIDEDALFEDFRDRIRASVTEHLDQLMADMGIPSDNPHRATLLGCRDEDLSRLFPALDRQAELLWGRGARQFLVEQAHQQATR